MAVKGAEGTGDEGVEGRGGNEAFAKDCHVLSPSFYFLSRAMQVLPAVCRLSEEHSGLVTLIKPQFEARKEQVRGRGSCLGF